MALVNRSFRVRCIPISWSYGLKNDMMSLMDEKELDKLSQLARISISKDEAGALLNKTSVILDYVGELGAYVKAVDASTDTEADRLFNILRADEVKTASETERQSLLSAFPAAKRECLQVKKIID